MLELNTLETARDRPGPGGSGRSRAVPGDSRRSRAVPSGPERAEAIYLCVCVEIFESTEPPTLTRVTADLRALNGTYRRNLVGNTHAHTTYIHSPLTRPPPAFAASRRHSPFSTASPFAAFHTASAAALIISVSIYLYDYP